MTGTTAFVECHNAPGFCGWRVILFTDDDQGSGYGGNASETSWWGTQADCRAIAAIVNQGML